MTLVEMFIALDTKADTHIVICQIALGTDQSCYLFNSPLMHTIDDDSTSESSEDSAQAAARAEVQKQRKLKPGTEMHKNSTDMCKCMLIVVLK